MDSQKKGILIVIGGAEDKKGDMLILKKFCSLLRKNDAKILVLTTATKYPEAVGDDYRKVFEKIGVNDIDILNIDTREDANDDKFVEKILNAKGIFFTGGDQLRITSIIGGTKAFDALLSSYKGGGIIAGTSAGASAISSAMIVEGESNEPARKCTLKLAPGLNFLGNVIVDQHFAQRGRIGRLICSVAENPDVLGIGIDEDTAIIVYPEEYFEVYGTNSVTVIDGKSISGSNVSELEPDQNLAISNVTLHLLPEGYCFNLKDRETFKLNRIISHNTIGGLK